ncbi:conserved Plasmodium protein, unknown function [Plasmodium sp. gorilla clade G3]|nr:conserved Plasmodium protein, unknown function [Plasmodium sp. gorilla clade G3]
MEYIIKNEKEHSIIKNTEVNIFNVDNNKINKIYNNVITSELCTTNFNILYHNDTIKKKEEEKQNGDMIEEENNYENKLNIINEDNQQNEETIIKNNITYNNSSNSFCYDFNNNNTSQNHISMNILKNESLKNKHKLTTNENNVMKKRKKKTKKKNIYINSQREENNNLNYINIQMKNEIKKNIQKKMNQNDYLLCTINEFLKQGLKNECIPLFQRLQQNLFFLVMLANQPEDNLDDAQSNYSSE